MFQDSQAKQCKEILRKNNLNPIERLGKGGFGTVYLVSKVDFQAYDTELFSVKCTNKKNFVKKPVLRRYLKQEINLMSTLDHPNIVRLIRTFQDEGWIFMVMEYCNKGNLSSLLSKKPNKVLSFSQAKKIAVQIIDGLVYMHSKKIVHRDIKPQNILLTKDEYTDILTTKICDLGFSRQIKEQADTVCGTTYYMAPEIFEKKKYDHKVDIWALGVLFFYMLFGNVPFKSVNMAVEIQKKCEKGFNLDQIKTKPNPSINESEKQELKALFSRIFQIDPNDRISLEEFKEILRRQQNCSPKNSCQKETIESEVSSEEEMPLYVQEVHFIQSVLKEVMEMKYLENMEEAALKYYLDKVCLSILAEHSHQSIQCKYINPKQMEMMRKTQNSQTIYLASNLQKIGIKKFEEVFSIHQTTKFQNFKEAYRLVVGHAFYKAHKLIEDHGLKCQIKLKLFCCHVINRVFQEENSLELFRHYYKWQYQHKKVGNLNLTYFREWIQTEKAEKLLESIEAINNKFYKKRK